MYSETISAIVDLYTWGVSMQRNEQASKKKPYRSPRLRIYATLRELTESRNSMVGASDGAYGTFLKTG